MKRRLSQKLNSVIAKKTTKNVYLNQRTDKKPCKPSVCGFFYAKNAFDLSSQRINDTAACKGLYLGVWSVISSDYKPMSSIEV